MKKMLKKMIALMAVLAVILSFPVARSTDPDKGSSPKPPVYEEWDEGASRN